MFTNTGRYDNEAHTEYTRTRVPCAGCGTFVAAQSVGPDGRSCVPCRGTS